MSVVYGVVALVGSTLLVVLAWLLKGVIAAAGKKGAEHAWENREEYREWWESRRNK